VAGWQWIGAVALLAGITASAWWLRRRFPFAPTGWLWFLGTLVPVIGIVQVGSQAMADRYTYIPLIGIVWALVWLGGELVTKAGLPRMAVGVISAGIVAALGWRTTAQLTYWRNTETLFRYTLTLSPNSVQALFGLGSYAVDHGQTQEGKKLLEQAIQLQPTFADAIGTLASVLDGEGRYAEAVRYYQDALKAQPDHPGVLNNLAWLRAACADAKFRDGQQAVQLATRACELTEWSKPLFIGTLAAAQAETGDFQAAIATGERAATLASALGLPDTAERNHALIELYRQGKAAHGGPPGAER
jgi:tetratricopeptide (TPR) repeat protein